MNQGVGAARETPRENEEPTTSASERDRLILEHIEQVQLIARRIYDRLPQSVNFDDLVSAGILGLISAIDHYDAGQQVKLKTYAEYKIRGAMLDSLRGLDWVPRLHRKRARDIEDAILRLGQDFQRVPYAEEIADHLGISIVEYQEWLSEACGFSLTSLDSALRTGSGETRTCLEVPDASVDLPSEILERAEMEQMLAAGLEEMPDLQRTILNLYYYQELTLREISQITGLHESRISQIKAQGIVQLRSRLHLR